MQARKCARKTNQGERKNKTADLTDARTPTERGRAVSEVPFSVPGLGLTLPHQTVKVIQAAVGGEFSQRWQAAERQENETGNGWQREDKEEHEK